jgi:hypothetical protein
MLRLICLAPSTQLCSPIQPHLLAIEGAFPIPQGAKDLPVRPLLVQHTMSTVPAPDRLAALERDILVAVAALVVDGARRGVDLCRVLRRGVGVVCLGGHFWRGGE